MVVENVSVEFHAKAVLQKDNLFHLAEKLHNQENQNLWRIKWILNLKR